MNDSYEFYEGCFNKEYYDIFVIKYELSFYNNDEKWDYCSLKRQIYQYDS